MFLAARKYAISLKHYLAQDLQSCAFIPDETNLAACSEAVEVEHGDRDHPPWMADSIARPRGRYIVGPIHISIWKESLGALEHSQLYLEASFLARNAPKTVARVDIGVDISWTGLVW